MKKFLLAIVLIVLTFARGSATTYYEDGYIFYENDDEDNYLCLVFQVLENNKLSLVDTSLSDGDDLVIPATVSCEGVEYTVTEFTGLRISFRSISIPYTIDSIPTGIFKETPILEEFNVHPDNQFYKSLNGNLYSKDGTKFIACPKNITELTIADGVKEISIYAISNTALGTVILPDGVETLQPCAVYCNNNLTSINFPESLKRIEQSAIYECSITSAYIPANLEFLGIYNFSKCPIESIEVSVDNQYYSGYDGCVYSKDFSEFICCPGGKTTVSFHQNIRSISNCAFWECENISYINLPASITNIGFGSFSQSGLKEIVIPNQIKVIQTDVFEYCNNLSKVIIPESVESIYSSAFAYCPKLEMVTVPNSVKNMSGDAFYQQQNESNLVVALLNPDTKISVPDYTHGKDFTTYYAKGNTYENLKEAIPEATVLPLPEIPLAIPTPAILGPNSSATLDGFLMLAPACGFQVDMTLPTGLAIENIETVEYNENLKLSFSRLDNGDYRFIGCTTDGSIIPATEIIISLVSDETLTRGEIFCHDALLSIDDQEYRCSNQSITVTGYDVNINLPTAMIEGESVTLSNPIENAPEGVSYSWRTSDENIATIENNVLTAHNKGTVGITLDLVDPAFFDNFTYTLEVLAALWGDVDNSGKIDVADMVAMINHILGRNPENFDSKLADIDRNGRINIVDLTALIKIILAQPKEEAPQNGCAYAPSANREISFGEATALGDDRYSIPVEIDATTGYAALQAEIVLPESIGLESITLGEGLGSHAIDYAMLTPSTARFVIYSASLAEVPANRKSVLANLTVRGNIGSNDIIRLTDAIACDADCSAYSIADATTNIGGLSGLNDISASQCVAKAVEGGIELNAPEGVTARVADICGRIVADVAAPATVTAAPGVYIVAFSNGHIVKLVVK